jgi:sialidase-1
MVLSAPAGANSLSVGLRLWVPFEGTLEDRGPGGYDGVAVDTEAPGYLDGSMGSAANFDGINDAVRFPTLPNSVFSGNFSIAWWMRVPAHAKYSVLGKRTVCGVGQAFDMRTTPTVPSQSRFEAMTAAGFITALGAPLVPGEWMHLAVVREGATARIYTDGVAAPSSNVGSMDLSQASAPFGISVSPCITAAEGTVRLTGQIDELRVYSRALTPTEVALLAGPYLFADEFEAPSPP